MSSTRRNVKVTETFRDAETLAEFANLEPTDSAAVAYFRNNYPDFAPKEWWDYPYLIDGMRVLRHDDVIKIAKSDPKFKTKIENKLVQQWQHAQEQIQRAWKAGFKFKNISEVEILKLVFCVDRPGLAWNSSQLLLPDGTVYELNTKLYSFHKAVLYLHQHPRQAKICKKCRKYFVHVHGKRKFCEYPDPRGETCRHKNDNKRRLDYYYETGKKKRQAKTKKGRVSDGGRKDTTR